MELLRLTEKTEVFNLAKRFEQIQALRHTLGLQPLALETYGAHVDDVPSAPTIGIEIEMSWMQAFPDMGLKWKDAAVRPSDLHRYTPQYKEFHREYDRHDKTLKPILEQIEHVIPRVGHDAYWEFSFLPSKQIGVSIAEVQTLYDAGILNSNIAYATHMTVADIDNDRDAFAFLCGLELSGGSNLDRIEAAIRSSKGAWSRKGRGGLLKRQPSELMGDDNVGYEFRTLAATSFGQMSSLFHTAQQLADIFKHDPAGWKQYRFHIESYLKENGLSLEVWRQPRNDIEPWQAYGALLGLKINNKQ